MLYRVNNPREAQVFEYDALTLEECHVLVVKCSACMGYMEQLTTILVTIKCQVSCNKLPNSKLELSARIESCLSNLKFQSPSYGRGACCALARVFDIYVHIVYIKSSF